MITLDQGSHLIAEKQWLEEKMNKEMNKEMLEKKTLSELVEIYRELRPAEGVTRFSSKAAAIRRILRAVEEDKNPRVFSMDTSIAELCYELGILFGSASIERREDGKIAVIGLDHTGKIKEVHIMVKEKKPSKMDLARKIVQETAGLPRKEVLVRLQQEAGLTKAGAATYYQKLKNVREK